MEYLKKSDKNEECSSKRSVCANHIVSGVDCKLLAQSPLGFALLWAPESKLPRSEPASISVCLRTHEKSFGRI